MVFNASQEKIGAIVVMLQFIEATFIKAQIAQQIHLVRKLTPEGSHVHLALYHSLMISWTEESPKTI
jgi:hypothetical protein